MKIDQKIYDQMIGKKFGRLTVVCFTGIDPVQRCKKYDCKCDCGKLVNTRGNALRYKSNPSCGCTRFDNFSIGDATRKHGMTHTAEYQAWVSMRSRCYNIKCEQFKNYGARGITVCDEWKNNFEVFFLALGKKPSPAHSLDRINVNKNYTPENCRWATAREQQRNRRNNRILILHGVAKCLQEWADISGMSPATILKRIKRGWGVEIALCK